MALLSRQNVIAAKIETSPGTYEALAAADAAHNVMNLVVTPDVPSINRPGQSNLSKLASVPAGRKCKVAFDTDLVGTASNGTDPLWATTFLAAAGWLGNTNVWKPSTLDPSTISIGVYQDGLMYKIVGAKGNCEIRLKTGEPGVVHFEFEGVLSANTDVALLAPTYPTVIPPRFAGATFTVGGLTPKCSTATFKFSNTIKVAEDPATASAYHRAYIVDRAFEFTCDPEASLVATYDPQSLMFAGTEVAISCALGATAGNVITIAVPKAQIINVQPGDRDGLHVHNLTCVMNRNASLGDDEASITFA